MIDIEIAIEVIAIDSIKKVSGLWFGDKGYTKNVTDKAVKIHQSFSSRVYCVGHTELKHISH